MTAIHAILILAGLVTGAALYAAALDLVGWLAGNGRARAIGLFLYEAVKMVVGFAAAVTIANACLWLAGALVYVVYHAVR